MEPVNGNSSVFFQFKPNIVKKTGEPVYLTDVIEIFCPQGVKESIDDMIVVPADQNKDHVITAIEVIRLISEKAGISDIRVIGDGKALIEYKEPQSSKVIVGLLKAVLTALLLMIGSALAIMYFHADVNMHQVHSTLHYIITGEKSARPLLISIPYSIGIGIGIAVFFDVFSIRRKRHRPGPLELEVYTYEKEFYSYRKDEEEKEEG
nr:stage V sporulation protein AA [Caldicoprobacter guelmensis]